MALWRQGGKNEYNVTKMPKILQQTIVWHSVISGRKLWDGEPSLTFYFSLQVIFLPFVLLSFIVYFSMRVWISAEIFEIVCFISSPIGEICAGEHCFKQQSLQETKEFRRKKKRRKLPLRILYLPYIYIYEYYTKSSGACILMRSFLLETGDCSGLFFLAGSQRKTREERRFMRRYGAVVVGFLF